MRNKIDDNSQVFCEKNHPPKVDFGVLDIVLGLVTLPLLLMVLMYFVTGADQVFSTRSSRYRLYAILLGVEAIIVVGIAIVVFR